MREEKLSALQMLQRARFENKRNVGEKKISFLQVMQKLGGGQVEKKGGHDDSFIADPESPDELIEAKNIPVLKQRE